MFESPKSLTATIYVRFHYKETETKPLTESETAMINSILDKASLLPPNQQEILIKFADYLNQLGKEEVAEP